MTPAVADSAYLAPPSTQPTTAASPSAKVAFAPTELPVLPRIVLTALPTRPVTSFLPALRILPPCWTAVQALPTSPLISPPTAQTGLSGLNAAAGGAAAPVAQALQTIVATASCLIRIPVASVGRA